MRIETAYIFCLSLSIFDLVQLQSPTNDPLCLFVQDPPLSNIFILNCRGGKNKLKEIPFLSPTTLYISKLFFSFNLITTIRANTFQSVRTATLLDLTQNQIAIIDEHAFDGLDQLTDLSISIAANFPPSEWSWVPMAPVMATIRTLFISRYRIQLDNTTFSQAMNLERITLQDGGIKSIPDQLFMNIGPRITYLDFDKNKLTSFPTKALSYTPNLNVLNISNNPLGSLAANAVPSNIQNLGIIEFDNCSLTSISHFAFANNLASTMHFLDLSKNFLNQDVFETLVALRTLSMLSLAKNNISNIDDAFRSCCQNLQTIDLSGNRLQRLSAASFAPLAELRVLNLERNNISMIDIRAFEGLTSLSELLLRGNSLAGEAINSIPSLSQLLSPMGQSLRVLDLSDVGFREEHHTLFKPLRRLEHLYMSDNPIRSVPDYLFQSLTSLRRLDLQRSQLSAFSALSLVGPRQLTSLDLSNNNISSLDVCLQWLIRNASTLVFESNPLRCDCNLRWLRAWRNDTNIFALCSAPPSLALQEFYNVPVSGFVCEAPGEAAARNLSDCEDLDLRILQSVSEPLDWSLQVNLVSATLVYINYQIRWSELLLAYSPAHVFSLEFIAKTGDALPATLSAPINATGLITDAPQIRAPVPDSPYPTHLRACLLFVSNRRNAWLNPINCRTEAIQSEAFASLIPLFIGVPLLLLVCSAGVVVTIVLCCVCARNRKGITKRDISAPITQQTLASLVHTLDRYEKTTGIKSAGSQQDLVSAAALAADEASAKRGSRWGSSPNLAPGPKQQASEENEYYNTPLPKRPMRDKSIKRMRDREAAWKRGDRVSTRSQIETIYEKMPGEDPDAPPAPLPGELRLSSIPEKSESSPGDRSSGLSSSGQTPEQRTAREPRTSAPPAPPVIDPRSSQSDPSPSIAAPTSTAVEFMPLPLTPPPNDADEYEYANSAFERSAARPPSGEYNIPRPKPTIKADPKKPLPKLYAAEEPTRLDEYQLPPAQTPSAPQSQAAALDEYLVPPPRNPPAQSNDVPLAEYLSPPLRSVAGGAPASNSPANFRSSIDEYANLRASRFKDQTALLDFVDDSLQ